MLSEHSARTEKWPNDENVGGIVYTALLVAQVAAASLLAGEPMPDRKKLDSLGSKGVMIEALESGRARKPTTMSSVLLTFN